MSGFSVGYEIGRSTGRCALSGEPLLPGQACVATLCEREQDEGFERQDFSVAAWEGGQRPERLFSYWKSVVPESDRPRRLLADDDVLMDLFRRLESDDRPQRVAFRFVLGLALMRKKLLRCTGREDRNGVEWWKMVVKGEMQETLDMVNPRLSDEDARAISEQLGEALNAEL